MKRNVKKVLSFVLALVVVLSTALPAVAAQREEIKPQYIGITNIASKLSISSTGEATCNARVYNDGEYDVTIIISLKRDGTTIKTWSLSADVGANRIERSCYVTSGHDYQAVVTAQIKSNGSLLQSYCAYSSVVSY